MLILRTRLFGALQSQRLSNNFSIKIITVFLGSFTEDATCTLDFTQGKNNRYKGTGPADGHQLLQLSSVTNVTMLGFSPDVHQGDTSYPRAWEPDRWWRMIWSCSCTGKGFKCCSAVLGKWGLLTGATHESWMRATTLCEVLPARREAWEVWTLSEGLSLSAGTLSLFTTWVFDTFHLQVIAVHNTVRHKLQQKSIWVWFIKGSDLPLSSASPLAAVQVQILVCNARHTVREREKWMKGEKLKVENKPAVPS